MEVNQAANSVKSLSFCKNHSEETALYYLADHPQTKYCKNCALNVAICGRKIQRQLTVEEQSRKEKIGNVSAQMQNCVEVAKMNQIMFMKLEQYAQELAVPLENRLNEVQKVINQLTEIKDSLKKIFQEDILAEIEKFRNLVDLSKKYQEQLAKEVEGIESNLSNLIQIQDSDQFEREQTNLKEILNHYQEQILNQISFDVVKEQIKEKYRQFVIIFDKATTMKVHQFEGVISHKQPQSVDRVLSPLHVNNLESSRLVEQLKINLTANAQTKNKKKHPYEVPRKTSRKVENSENIENYVVPARKNKNR